MDQKSSITTTTGVDVILGIDQAIARSLVIPFFVMMSGVLGDGSSRRGFSKEDQPAMAATSNCQE
ncbi:MAG: hypothetical protein DRJ50_12130 [Actinobacteria bacterium]|nr:MAG: hypothetical protein DRJ50_12130 [Actinomycetota bacterium]